MQTKKISMIESLAQTIVGLVISFGIQVIIYPALNIEVTMGENLLIAFIFFISSLVRGYVLRRVFDKIFIKEK